MKKRKKCQGGCEEHSGEVRTIRVRGHLIDEKFDYCDEAIKEDENKGFTITNAQKSK